MVFVKTEAEAAGHLYRAVSQSRIASKAMQRLQTFAEEPRLDKRYADQRLLSV
jgi:hypothetical protein